MLSSKVNDLMSGFVGAQMLSTRANARLLVLAPGSASRARLLESLQHHGVSNLIELTSSIVFPANSTCNSISAALISLWKRFPSTATRPRLTFAVDGCAGREPVRPDRRLPRRTEHPLEPRPGRVGDGRSTSIRRNRGDTCFGPSETIGVPLHPPCPHGIIICHGRGGFCAQC